jgi:hypothetical protein
VCRQSLNLTERTWRCEQGHSYDVAKQGYVNLHVVQHKHIKTCLATFNYSLVLFVVNKSLRVVQQRCDLHLWRCEQGHSYDVAKQGYVNLHVVQHKHSKNPGDTPLLSHF